MESPWPLMYFVRLSTAKSAPSSMGRWLKGEAKVLSTLSSAPCRWAISAMAAMSEIMRVGLPGVSMCMSLVFGRMAASTFAGSVVSTIVVSTPNLLLSSSFKSLYTAM